MSIDLIPFEPGMEGKFIPYEVLEEETSSVPEEGWENISPLPKE